MTGKRYGVRLGLLCGLLLGFGGGQAWGAFTVSNLELGAAPSPRVSGNLAAFRVSESDQGSDLNGDSDTNDDVLHVFEAASGTTTNLALAASSIDISDTLVAFMVRESDQGSDFNGDSDTNDDVLHVFEAASGTTTNLARDAFADEGVVVSDTLVAFRVSESRQGNTDLNGDSDTNDFVMHVATIDEASMTGDLDSDGDVDRDDLGVILAARNTPASGPDDPRDLDGDGQITVLDARQLVLLCTRPGCATE